MLCIAFQMSVKFTLYPLYQSSRVRYKSHNISGQDFKGLRHSKQGQNRNTKLPIRSQDSCISTCDCQQQYTTRQTDYFWGRKKFGGWNVNWLGSINFCFQWSVCRRVANSMASGYLSRRTRGPSSVKALACLRWSQSGTGSDFGTRAEQILSSTFTTLHHIRVVLSFLHQGSVAFAMDHEFYYFKTFSNKWKKKKTVFLDKKSK